MRTISLVNRLRWSFGGNMNPHALVVGDADNDGVRLCVFGHSTAFKSNHFPPRRTTNLLLAISMEISLYLKAIVSIACQLTFAGVLARLVCIIATIMCILPRVGALITFVIYRSLVLPLEMLVTAARLA